MAPPREVAGPFILIGLRRVPCGRLLGGLLCEVDQVLHDGWRRTEALANACCTRPPSKTEKPAPMTFVASVMNCWSWSSGPADARNAATASGGAFEASAIPRWATAKTP